MELTDGKSVNTSWEKKESFEIHVNVELLILVADQKDTHPAKEVYCRFWSGIDLETNTMS